MIFCQKQASTAHGNPPFFATQEVDIPMDFPSEISAYRNLYIFVERRAIKPENFPVCHSETNKNAILSDGRSARQRIRDSTANLPLANCMERSPSSRQTATAHRAAASRWVRILFRGQQKNAILLDGVFLLAEDEGFEPPQTESESGVLPLHKSSIWNSSIICKISKKSIPFFFFLFIFYAPEK